MCGASARARECRHEFAPRPKPRVNIATDDERERDETVFNALHPRVTPREQGQFDGAAELVALAVVEGQMHLKAERIGEVAARPPQAGEFHFSGREHDCGRRKVRHGVVAADRHARAVECDGAGAAFDPGPGRTCGLE